MGWSVGQLRNQEQRLQVAEMRMLRYTSGGFLKGTGFSLSTRGILGVTDVREEDGGHWLQRFGQMKRKGAAGLVRAILGLSGG